MTMTIKAIFENGVFKPLQKIDLNEHEKVEIRVLANDEWQRRFAGVIRRIHNRASQYTDDEIENDIIQTVNECRKQRDDHKDCY